jgi:m7GpppX diphosphatase
MVTSRMKVSVASDDQAVDAPLPSSETASDDDAIAVVVVGGPLDILSGSGGCIAHSLTVSDQHATLLLTPPPPAVATEQTAARTTSSILKLTLVPYHKAILGSNPVCSADMMERGQRPERNMLESDRRAGEAIVSFLRGFDYELKSESGAEYAYYTARPRIGPAADVGPPAPSSPSGDVGAFDVELISPATPHQISRAMPSLGHVLICETPELYREVVEPYIRSVVDNGSLSWINNVVEGRKERERLLVDHGDFVINVDTKWRSHPPPLTTPREIWHGHPSTSDLYCLGITKIRDLRCIRDLRRMHAPMLAAMERSGLDAIRDVYGVPEDQVRVYAHYQPQFYHFHVHFTRLENEVGCCVERGHLVCDVVQNLMMDDAYYAGRTITYKLPRGTPLLSLIEEYRSRSVDGRE